MNALVRRLNALVLCLLLQPAFAAPSQHEALVVFAAASLTEVVQQIADNYTKATGTPVRLSFAATSTLARQIESGAGADIFFSADQEWMDYLAERGLIEHSSRRDVLENRLALIASVRTTLELTLDDADAMFAALAGKRLAVADPDVVPAGKYAREVLSSIDLWQRVENRLARADNVRAALMYVARGEAPLGIVYATDARLEPAVRTLGLFPVSAHTPIVYPIAALDGSDERATAFIEFLSSPESTRIFHDAGFGIAARRD